MPGPGVGNRPGWSPVAGTPGGYAPDVGAGRTAAAGGLRLQSNKSADRRPAARSPARPAGDAAMKALWGAEGSCSRSVGTGLRVAQEVAVAVVLDRAGERRVGRPFEGVVVAALGEAVHEEAREDRASAFITAVPSTGSVVGDKVWTGFGRYRRGVHPTVQCSMDGQLRRPGGAPRHDVGSVPHQDVGTVCRRALLLARVRAGARAAARSRPLARSDSRLNISSRRS